MKRDLKRHRLLKILAEKRVIFEAGKLQEGESLGVSFDDLLIKMNCDILTLNLITSELYDNNEIKYHNAYDVIGIFCEKAGLTSFANNKYKVRYWRDVWTNLFTISQIIVPILALVIALIAVIDSRQSRGHTEEILLLRKEIHKIQEKQDSQTNRISELTTISVNDSLQLTDK